MTWPFTSSFPGGLQAPSFLPIPQGWLLRDNTCQATQGHPKGTTVLTCKFGGKTSELEEHCQVGVSSGQRDCGLLGGGGEEEVRGSRGERCRSPGGGCWTPEKGQVIPEFAQSPGQQQKAETSILTGSFSALTLTQASSSEAGEMRLHVRLGG